MGGLLYGLLGLVATLQVLVAQAPRVSAALLVRRGGLLQGGSVRQVRRGSRILQQAHPGAADNDIVGETTTPTLLWRSATGGVGGEEVLVAAGGRPPFILPQEEQDTSPHSAASLDSRGTGGGGSEQLASRMGTSGSGGTEESEGGGTGGGASRTSHDEHRNVATPNAARRRPGRSPGAPPAPRGADGGSSTPTPPAPIPPQDAAAMAARSAPNQYRNNNNLGSSSTTSGTAPPPPEDTLRPTQRDIATAMAPPEVNNAPTGTVNLAAFVDTRKSSSSSSSEEGDRDASVLAPEPTLAPRITRHYYTFPPGFRPNLAYFGFVVYDTTPGYHGNTDHAHAHRLQGRDSTVWIAILSVACFLVGIMITSLVCYAIYRRKWQRHATSQHLEDDLPVSDDLLYSSDNILTDDPLDPTGVGSGSGGSSSSGAAHGGSTEALLPVGSGNTDLELLTCSQTNLLQSDFLSDIHVLDNCRRGGGGGHIALHRHPTEQLYQQQGVGEGGGDKDLSTQRRPSRIGSTSTCSRSSCSTCSTVLTLDSPEEGGLRRSSNGSATGGSPGGVSWGFTSSRHGSVSTDNGYFTPGGSSSLVDWTSET